MLADGPSTKAALPAGSQLMEISATKTGGTSEASVKREGSYSFAIHNWNCATNNVGESIVSPPFAVDGEERWAIEVFPHGIDATDDDSVCIQLYNIAHMTYRISCKISFLSPDDSVSVSIESNAMDQLRCTDQWMVRKVMPFKKGLELCKGNVLTMKVDMTISGPSTPGKLNFVADDQSHSLISDLTMLIDGYKADVFLCSGDQKIGCHKCILGIRSPVFKSMFQSAEKAAKLVLFGGRLNVEKINPDCLKEFVQFIYTDSCSISRWDINLAANLKSVCHLLQASIKYRVGGLQALCESVLTKGISAENSCEILTVAANCGLTELKIACLKFISLHYNDVRKSDAYKALNADLLRDILAEIGPAAVAAQTSSSAETSPVGKTTSKAQATTTTAEGSTKQKPAEGGGGVQALAKSQSLGNEAKSTSDDDASLKKVLSAPAIMGSSSSASGNINAPSSSSSSQADTSSPAPPKSPVLPDGTPSEQLQQQQREVQPGKHSPFRFFGRI